MNLKFRSQNKIPLMTVSSDFYEGFRVALQQCHNQDVKSLYFTCLSQILISFVRNDTPIKHSTYLCKVISTSGQMTNDSAVTTTIMLVRFVLPNVNPENYQTHLWVPRVLNRIQQKFMSLEISLETLDSRLFFIYFLKILLETHFMDLTWIYEKIIKNFFCHNGLRWLMKTMKYSKETKNFLGVYLSKQLLIHVLAFMEIQKMLSSENALEILSQAKLKYEKVFSSQLIGSTGLLNADYDRYDFVSGVDFILLEFEEWMVMVIFLYIGVNFVKKVDLVSIYVNIVSLLDMALVKEFEISDGLKDMMMEIYCVSIKI